MTFKEKATQEIVERMGYKSFDDEWGREHLVNGNDKYFFDAASLDAFRLLVSVRAKYLELKTSAQGVVAWEKEYRTLNHLGPKAPDVFETLASLSAD